MHGYQNNRHKIDIQTNQHYYRNDLWSFTFVPAGIGPGTKGVFSPGSNG